MTSNPSREPHAPADFPGGFARRLKIATCLDHRRAHRDSARVRPGPQHLVRAMLTLSPSTQVS